MVYVAILIPVFNGLEYTKVCLHSITEAIDDLSSEKVRFSLVVVDDGSSDGTFEWIVEHYPSVELVKGNGDLWWSGSINLGVTHAIHQVGVDYILWWNNDIVPDKEYFKNLAVILQKTSPDIIHGSKIYLAQKEQVIWSMGGIFDTRSGVKDMIGRNCKDGAEFNKIQSCDWLPGMGTVIHRSVYDKIGLVDAENFPQYHGDSDFTFRAKLEGFSIQVSPELKIYNDTSNSGLVHNESFKKMIQSLFTIKSNYNIQKDILFYRRYVTSPRAYLFLLKRYISYIGGFFKWKFFSLFGIKRSNDHLSRIAKN